MILFYSGSCGAQAGEPETILGDRVNLMLSYWLISQKSQNQHKRWPRIVEVRKRKRKKKK